MSGQNRSWPLRGAGLIAVLLGLGASPEPEAISVRGIARVRAAATTYIHLMRKADFDSGNSSPWLLKIPVSAEDARRGWVRFEFPAIPPGDYGIQAFQDLNGNGKLDIGLFGPTEPWGLSCYPRPMFRGPTWEEIRFRAFEGMKELEIRIE